MLSPQIYIAKFDKTLTFKSLDYTSHKVSSLVIAGTKAKAQKGAKTRENEGKTHRTGTMVIRAKMRSKKVCEKWRLYERKTITSVICRVES